MADNLRHICRLCAKEDRFCIEVFGEDGQKNSISKKIRLCLPIIIRETDNYPKQICLSCLNKLDTCYELYSGCVNAQNTIKRIMTALNITPCHTENLPEELPLDEINLIAQQVSSLNVNNPVVKAGPCFLMMTEKRTAEVAPQQPRLKVRRLETRGSGVSEQQSNTSLVAEVENNENKDDDDDDANDNDDLLVGCNNSDEEVGTSAGQQTLTSHISTDPMQVPGFVTAPSLSLLSQTQPQVYIPDSFKQGTFLQRMLKDVPHCQFDGNQEQSAQNGANLVSANSVRYKQINIPPVTLQTYSAQRGRLARAKNSSSFNQQSSVTKTGILQTTASTTGGTNSVTAGGSSGTQKSHSSPLHPARIQQIKETHGRAVETRQVGRSSKRPIPERITARHFIERIPSTEKKVRPYKRCTVCCKRTGKRKETQYWCKECRVGLCLSNCFRVYHTGVNF